MIMHLQNLPTFLYDLHEAMEELPISSFVSICSDVFSRKL